MGELLQGPGGRQVRGAPKVCLLCGGAGSGRVAATHDAPPRLLHLMPASSCSPMQAALAACVG